MTVLGPIHASQLGRTLVHEHLRIVHNGSALDPKNKMSRREVVARAVDRLAELRSNGISSLVDPCPIELGRDVEMMAEVSQRSGVHVVCSTGFYYEHDGVGIPFYWRTRWASEIADLYVREIEEGVGDTGIRPGIIKAASGNPVGRHDRKVLSAAGIAARATGVPIITHTTGSAWGQTQQEIFADQGTALGRCLIGHLDEAPVDEILAIAARGSFVGIDRVGFRTIATEEARLALVAAVIDAGFAAQLCLSQDHICVGSATRPAIWVSEANAATVMRDVMPDLEHDIHGRSSSYLVTDFLPRLLEIGVTQVDIDRIMIDNPRRLLTRQPI